MATTTFSIIFAGDAVTEIGAILVALLTKEVVANIPESSLMDALRGLPVESNSIIPSESYGKPPTLVIPIKSLPKGVIVPPHILAAASPATTAETPHEPENRVSNSTQGGAGAGEPTISLLLYHAKDPDILNATTVKPNVLVLCHCPAVPKTCERASTVWLNAVDRMYPRPPLVLCGARTESLGSRSVVQVMREVNALPMHVDELCDVVLRWRAVTYCEISALYNVNISTDLLATLLRVCFGEAEKRITPSAVATMRQSCVQALLDIQAVWSARRNPKNNKLYYYNRLTKKAQYFRPRDYDGEEPELTREERIQEELRRQQEDEQRLLDEREERDLALYRVEMESQGVRLQDLTTRHHILNTETNRLIVELDKLRDRQQVLLAERQQLERKREEVELEEQMFSKSSVQLDRELDVQIQVAQTKTFELEAVAMLQSEAEFALPISETLVTNRGLASQIRSLLQEQLQIQSVSQETQAAYEASQRMLEQVTLEIASLDEPLKNAQQTQRATVDALDAVLANERTLIERVKAAEKEFSAAQTASTTRHRRIEELQQELQRLDDEHTALSSTPSTGPKSTSSSTSQAAMEVERLDLLITQLVEEFARESSRVAHTNLSIAKWEAHVRYAVDTFRDVAEPTMDRSRKHVEKQAEIARSWGEGKGYTPVARRHLQETLYALHRELSALEEHPQATTTGSAATAGGKRIPSTAPAAAALSAHAAHREVRRAELVSQMELIAERINNVEEAENAAGNATVALSTHQTWARRISQQKAGLLEVLKLAHAAMEASGYDEAGTSTRRGAKPQPPLERAVQTFLRIVCPQGASQLYQQKLLKLLVTTFREEVIRAMQLPISMTATTRGSPVRTAVGGRDDGEDGWSINQTLVDRLRAFHHPPTRATSAAAVAASPCRDRKGAVSDLSTYPAATSPLFGEPPQLQSASAAGSRELLLYGVGGGAQETLTESTKQLSRQVKGAADAETRYRQLKEKIAPQMKAESRSLSRR